MFYAITLMASGLLIIHGIVMFVRARTLSPWALRRLEERHARSAWNSGTGWATVRWFKRRGALSVVSGLGMLIVALLVAQLRGVP